MIMFRFSTSVRTQDNITSHFCLIARRIGTPYHQMIISGSSIGRNNNIMMMYFCILQTGNIIYLVKSKSCVCLPACDNDEKGDVTKPVIDLIEPEEGAVLKIGNGKGVHFEMNLSDDVMLRSYKINIHNNFDHHGHDSRADKQSI